MKMYNNMIAIPPGETIKDELDFLNMSQKEFADRLGMAAKTVNQIINGIAPITYETAIKLENVLGIPSSTWNNLEAEYREILIKIADAEKKEEEWKICEKLPYKDMMKKFWIKESKDELEIINEMKSFFSVASLKLLNNVNGVFNYYDKMTSSALFRKVNDKEICEYSMSAWIRKGEIEANKIETEVFSKEKLLDNITDMKKLSLENKKENIEKLKEICSKCGIVLVIIPHLKKIYVDGVSKWLSKDKALIILSNRGKKIDKFWFNFFHEIAHLLNHNKKDLFINAEETHELEIEKEANNYARDILISKEEFKNIKNLTLTKENILKLSKNLQIHPSIIVGRVQYEGLIKYSELNSLKEDIIL